MAVPPQTLATFGAARTDVVAGTVVVSATHPPGVRLDATTTAAAAASAAGLGAGTWWWTVYRLEGTVWRIVRGNVAGPSGQPAAPAGGRQWDFEAPDATTTYRWVPWSSTSTNPASPPYTPLVLAGAGLDLPQPYLIHPGTPALSVPCTIGQDRYRARAAAVSAEPLLSGAPPVAVWQPRSPRAGTLTVYVPRAKRAAVAALVADGSPLLLRQPCNDPVTDDGYLACRTISDDTLRAHTESNVAVVLEYQQVAAPPSSPAPAAATVLEWVAG